MQLRDERIKEDVTQPEKTEFKLFDFFGNYEYFETEYNYKQILKLLFPLDAMIRMEMALSFISALTSTGALMSSRPSARRKSGLRG